MLSVTLRQLEYATAIARHGSVTLAAEALHVSQPALSVATALLEAQLGQPLFLRRAGGPITPTSFGRSFLDAAEAQLAAIGQMLAANTITDTPVRLACFEDLAPVYLAPMLRHVARQHPDIPITPQVLGFEAMTDALRRGHIDLAVTYDLGLEADMTRQDLIRITPHAVLATDHPLAGRSHLLLADIAAHPLILADQGLSLGHMRALFSQKGLTPTIAHRTATLELMRSFAANGLGVGLSYTCPRPRLSYDGQPLIICPITDAGMGEPVVLAHLVSNPLSANAKTILAAIATLPELLPGQKI